MTRPPFRVIYEGAAAPREPVETMRFSIDVYDARGNLREVLGRLADLDPARAAFARACLKYPDKLIYLRQGGRTLAKIEEPPEWLPNYLPDRLGDQYRPLPLERRPQDPGLDGRELTFTTREHGGEYPDTMPQEIVATDPQGRSAVYVPMKVDGRVVERRDESE